MKEYITHENNTYEIVNSVPSGYEIWNIGKYAPDGYLPLCMRIAPDSYSINPDTLKAIKVDGAQTILEAVCGGQNTIKEMERYIRHYQNAKPGTYSYRQLQRIEKALPIMRTIKWE